MRRYVFGFSLSAVLLLGFHPSIGRADDKDAAAHLADTVRNPDPVKRPQ